MDTNDKIRIELDLDHLFGKMNVGLLQIDEDDVIMFANAKFCEMMEYEPAELIGQVTHKLFIKSEFQKHILEKIQNRAKDESGIYELAMFTKNGVLKWVRIHINPIEDNKNVIVGSLGFYIDITDQKLAENLLKESELRFRNLADTSPVLIWMSDTDNSSYYFNKTWLDFTGKTLEEEIGDGWKEGIHPEDKEKFAEEAGQNLEDQKSFSIEYRLRRKDGTYRWMLDIGTPRYLLDGQFAGYIGSCIDISDLKQAQKELEMQTVDLKRSNEELEQFAYVASHDLQEPLRMISSYVQLIQKKLLDQNDKELDELMNFAVDGVRRMKDLIHDLLEYSRVNTQGKPFEKVNCNDLMEAVKNNLLKLVEETNAKIIYKDLPQIKADASQMIRLFQNLIENSIKFKGEEDPVIEITAKKGRNEWLFAVKDNGTGIEKKYFDRIFVIFQRLHSRRDYKGTGIGLAVCKKIVERHGGHISVESEAKKGTVFNFSIANNPKQK